MHAHRIRVCWVEHLNVALCRRDWRASMDQRVSHFRSLDTITRGRLGVMDTWVVAKVVGNRRYHHVVGIAPILAPDHARVCGVQIICLSLALSRPRTILILGVLLALRLEQLGCAKKRHSQHVVFLQRQILSCHRR